VPFHVLRARLTEACFILGLGCAFWPTAPFAQVIAEIYPVPVEAGVETSQRQGIGSSGAAALGDGKLLVAARKLYDPNFARTIVLLLRHGTEGAIGLIINRPSQFRFTQLLPWVANTHLEKVKVHSGGPVAKNTVTMLVRAVSKPRGAREILQGVFASADITTVEALLAEPDSGVTVRAYIGYAGWAGGQLEGEIARGDWHVATPSAELIFEAVGGKDWDKLIKALEGVWVYKQEFRSKPGKRAGGHRSVCWADSIFVIHASRADLQCAAVRLSVLGNG